MFSESVMDVLKIFIRGFLQGFSGSLFTNDQITSISHNVVGQNIQDWLPNPEDTFDAKDRIEVAKIHLVEASNFISSLQIDLNKQSSQLENLIKEIENKKELAEHYSTLASLNEDEFNALKSEMSDSLKQELEAISNEGKRKRQLFKAFEIIVTLIAGAALGEYFGDIVSFLQGLFQ